MSTDPQPREPLRLPGWLKFIVVFFLVVGLIASFIWLMGAAATRRWEQFAADLRAKGQPVTFAEIEAQRTVIPDEINSARIIEALADELNKLGAPPIDKWVLVFGSKADVDLFGGLPRYVLDASTMFRDKHADLLDRLRPIRHMPEGRYSVDYSAPALQVVLPNLSKIRAAEKLAYLDALLAAADHRAADAVDDVVLQLRMAGSLADEPTLIARLVQVALEAVALRSLEIVLLAGELPETHVVHMKTEIDERLKNDSMRPAFLGERAYFVGACDDLLTGRLSAPGFVTLTQPPDAPTWLSLILRLPIWLVRTNQIKGAEMLSQLVDAGDDAAALTAAANSIDVETPKLPKTQVLTKLLMASVSRAIVLHHRITAELRCARAALAAEHFRMTTGRLPNALDELVPDFLDEVPADPFDAQPLRSKITDDGVVIYSIGENRGDDGGDVALRPKPSQRPMDVGFRLNRLDRRGIVILEDPPPADE